MEIKKSDKVVIKDGIYEGEIGRVIQLFPNGTCVIHLDDDSNVVVESKQISRF